MNDINRARVALIYGGRGHEREVSNRGKAHVLPLIDRERYSVFPIFIDKDGRWLYEDDEVFLIPGGFYCPTKSLSLPIDCAFPLLHGDFGEDGMVQGALECVKIPYVGSDYRVAAACRDKALVKAVAKSLDIPTLPFTLIIKCEGADYAVRRAESHFRYPMIVKPTCLGSSIGVCSANTKESLRQAVNKVFKISDRAIIEPCLTVKRELECGYFGTKSKELFTNPGEILLNGMYGYEEKYISPDVKTAVRADLGAEITERIREYSRRLVRALGVRHLARIDFFLSGGEIYFNEINTMPGFTEGSLYAKMIEGSGISEGALINMLVESALPGNLAE